MTTEVKQSEKVVTTLQPPNLWKVVLLNDDVTPMELVIDILISVFNHNETTAKEITLEIHNSGSGIAGVYNFEIAETMTKEAITIARSNGSPLKIQLEEER
jgi:ATP-dependent Clp protease adaptor protein ClpS